MTLLVDVHADALDEFEEAAAWYEARRPGLGFAFVTEIEQLTASIAERPMAFPQWKSEDPVRRVGARRFPYAVFYDVEPERVVVLAIAHSSRRPGYWGGRIGAAKPAPKTEGSP